MRHRVSVITARGLARTFQTKTGPVNAVAGVDIDVHPGEIVGILGPNGAGKTTTLRMLTTLIAPSAGTATVAGKDLRADPRGVRQRIGYVPQGGSTDPDAFVLEELVLQARLFGLSKSEAVANAKRLLTALDLPGLERRRCRELSGGQRRRVDIALGLAHEPKLIFLDEPTTGLDPQSRANLWEHVRGLQEGGKTVVLTTHYLDEADALCDRIFVMDHGVVVAVGTPDELKRSVSGDIITLELLPTDAPRTAEIAAAVLDLRHSHIDGNVVQFTVETGDKAIIPLLRALDAAAITPEALSVKRPSLDDVFLTLTGRSLRDEVEGSTTPVLEPAR